MHTKLIYGTYMHEDDATAGGWAMTMVAMDSGGVPAQHSAQQFLEIKMYRQAGAFKHFPRLLANRFSVAKRMTLIALSTLRQQF